ncbi:N-terminal EF-hand calcium-binding protein 1-like [Xenia sp. Carnegie-2017]|uniref:N-terminal EF-hand calcium-binding protein 1-like n=1 Tax=Xenia sp. Carnegie-2017 TaxID=2897299 RepID=UPI001F04B6A1|nr:N-terminal EF-hand calcium-binding protein 1-like [Xenia sp. Carnegie-2017]
MENQNNTQSKDGLSIFRDVFRRADKDDDGAISLAEFKRFFNDGILSEEELLKLFNVIDTHHTSFIDTQELCDYFQEHLGPFSSIFSGLECMNSAVKNVLTETAKNYPTANFFTSFTIRFLMRELLNQLGSLEYHVDTALDKIDSDEKSKRTGTPYTEQKTNEGTKKSRKKSQRQQPQMTNDGHSLSKLASQVDRLAHLVNQLESKVKLEIVEEEVDPNKDRTSIIVRRKFVVNTECHEEFKKSLKVFINSTGCAVGCLELSVRLFTNSDVFILYEIWSSKDSLKSWYVSPESKAFLRSNIDHLQRPEECIQMPIPAAWLEQDGASEDII